MGKFLTKAACVICSVLALICTIAIMIIIGVAQCIWLFLNATKLAFDHTLTCIYKLLRSD